MTRPPDGQGRARIGGWRRRWRRLRRILALLVSKTCDGEISEELSRTGRRLSVTFGDVCIFGLLCLEERGMGLTLDAKPIEAENILQTDSDLEDRCKVR
jgi:hypothetical protein